MIKDNNLKEDSLIWISEIDENGKADAISQLGLYNDNFYCRRNFYLPFIFNPSLSADEVIIFMDKKVTDEIKNKVNYPSRIYDKYKRLFSKKSEAVSDLFLNKYFDKQYDDYYIKKDLILPHNKLKINCKVFSKKFYFNALNNLRVLELPNFHGCRINSASLYTGSTKNPYSNLEKIVVGKNCSLNLKMIKKKKLIESIMSNSYENLRLTYCKLIYDKDLILNTKNSLALMDSKISARKIGFTNIEDSDDDDNVSIFRCKFIENKIDYIFSPTISFADIEVNKIDYVKCKLFVINNFLNDNLEIDKLELFTVTNERKAKLKTDVIKNIHIHELIIHPEINEFTIINGAIPESDTKCKVTIDKVTKLGEKSVGIVIGSKFSLSIKGGPQNQSGCSLLI